MNTLRRRFNRNPERQDEQESLWGAATLEQLRDEQAKRAGDYVRYRPRRIQRPQRPDALRDKLERQVKDLLKRQRNWERDYGGLDGFVEYNMRRPR